MPVAQHICDQLSDVEVVQKSIEDLEYFSCLYLRYGDKLLRYIHRISSVTDEEAEDILQEAFIKSWRNLNAFDESIKLSSWLYRIVHNQTISTWRKKKSFGKDKVVEVQEQYFKGENPDYNLEDGNQQENEINKILNLLQVNYREVLVLKYFEMMSYEEISDVLKIPEGTVATRMNRAKKAFEKLAKQQKIKFEI